MRTRTPDLAAGIRPMPEHAAGSAPSERRKATRYRLEVPVEWPGGSGLTRDVSRGGAYVVTDTPPASGLPLPLALALHDHLSGQRIPIRCLAEAVRVETNEGRWGVGIRFTSYEFDPGVPC